MDWSRPMLVASGRRFLAVVPLLGAAALLLLGCSSGGGNDSPSGGTSATSEEPLDPNATPPVEGSEESSAGQKTARPNGGFKNGPKPSANFSGQWPDVINVSVQNTTGAAYDAQLEIHDCTPGQPAQQMSTHISLAPGDPYDHTFSFTVQNPRIATHTLCGTLVQDGDGPVTTFSEAIEDPGAGTTEGPGDSEETSVTEGPSTADSPSTAESADPSDASTP